MSKTTMVIACARGEGEVSPWTLVTPLLGVPDCYRLLPLCIDDNHKNTFFSVNYLKWTIAIVKKLLKDMLTRKVG